LLGGFLIALFHHGLTIPAGIDPSLIVKGGWLGVIHTYPVEMAQNFWTAIFACASAATITVVLSLMTKQKKLSNELVGLVYQLTPREKDSHVVWYQRPLTLAIFVLALFILLSVLFW
jgi:SSS family solute:Na+ symporter